MPSGPTVEQLARRLEAIASGIEGRQPDAALLDLLQDAQCLCEQAGAQTADTELKTLLATLAQALTAWPQVWPRLGAQRVFRLAVAREAALWSKRIRAVGAHAA